MLSQHHNEDIISHVKGEKMTKGSKMKDFDMLDKRYELRKTI